MAQWNGSESGILRKTATSENHDELLVFGYACKLFRDDEKASYIDKGKHLIPWMGDDSLKIDRYDCRGALSDLSKYEASREGFDAMRWLGLSEKERQLEELCDKERYYSLKINEEEEEMYKEEEQKRQKTNAFQYTYDVPRDPDSQKSDATAPSGAEDEEEEYIPPPILDVPVDIDIPKTVKENARIEKTAMFVCKQGLQMEILIKAKQADNPQFSFLNQGDRLYKFYRHVLTAFKNGRYQGYEPKCDSNTEAQQEDGQDQDASGHYLHPSLLSASQQPEPPTAVPVPQVPYKPSSNCAYSQLVNRIQGNQTDSQQAEAKTAQAFSQMTYEQQQYYQYYYAQQYYDYYKQMAMYQHGEGGNPGQFVAPPDFQNLDPHIQSYIQQLAYSQYLQQQQQQQQQTNNSYAQIVSNVNKESNPYTANVPQLPQKLPQVKDVEPSKTLPSQVPQSETPTEAAVVKSGVIAKKPLLSLAVYGSGSESESEDTSEPEEEHEKRGEKVVYAVPTGETQTVIDKMAVYVSKNGEQFEDIVRAKGDPRFDFLNETHAYNKYYREKIRELKSEAKREETEEREVKEAKPKKEKKVIAPVSFSIKKAREEQPKEIRSALPVEESDEEESGGHTPSANAATPPSATNTIITIENSPREGLDMETSEREVRDVTKDKKNGIIDVDDPILEMIELSSDAIEEKKDAKRAEDRIKDKLAAAAREKLALASRDRALQLERKKKAAAFLKLKSAEHGPSSADASTDRARSSTPPSRRNSVEIIEVVKEKEVASKKSKTHERSRSRERRKAEREKSETKEKKKEVKTKEKKSRTPRKEEEEATEKKRRDDDRKEKKKKSHKRKHSRSRHESRSKKKSKKRHRRSESNSSDGSTSS